MSRNWISSADYLAGELVSPIKHEYLAAVVYAMVRARNLHNTIATNTLASLHSRLRGRRCRPFNSDTKIRVRLRSCAGKIPRTTRFKTIQP